MDEKKKKVSKFVRRTEPHCPEKGAADSWISYKVSCDAMSSAAFGAQPDYSGVKADPRNSDSQR